MARRAQHVRAHNWLIFRLLDPVLAAALRAHARGRLADIGCGARPYVSLTRGIVRQHVGIDPSPTQRRPGGADLSASAYAIPVADASFETVLCTDVLEHLAEPGDALAEAFRILEPEGVGIYSVPLHWHLHEEPRDFYRFTRHGLRHLFEKHGFEVLEIRAITGFPATYAQALAYYLFGLRQRFAVPPLTWILSWLIHAVQALGLLMNRLDPSERFTAEYVAVVRKPATAAGCSGGAP